MGLQTAFDLLLSSEKPLDGIDALIWQSLEGGAAVNKHPWSIGCVMTIKKTDDDSLCPSGRTVVLRRCDAVARTVDFYTDVRSAKVEEIELSEGALCWLFYEPSTRIQLRLQGNATVVNDHRADVAWEAVTLQSRSEYLSADPPGKQVWSQQPQVQQIVSWISQIPRSEEKTSGWFGRRFIRWTGFTCVREDMFERPSLMVRKVALRFLGWFPDCKPS